MYLYRVSDVPGPRSRGAPRSCAGPPGAAYDSRMTTHERSASETPSGPATALERTDAVELLGLVAQLEHTAFVRLAADSAIAPDKEQALELSRFAATSVQRRDKILARIAELGADPVETLRQFDDVLVDFDARTQPSTWWERLLKGYVGYGVADDFCRLAAEGIDEASRQLVLDVLDDAARTELALAQLDEAGAEDSVLSSRLALWGRRLVGEALTVVQRLMVQRPALARLVARGQGAAEPDAAPVTAGEQSAGAAVAAPANEPAKVFGELTAQHTRRMSRLGLTA